MRCVVIIDSKIIDTKGLSAYLSESVKDISWRVATTISEVDALKANMLFIHINNKGASNYITQMCLNYDEIYITSAAPSINQLNRVEGCKKVKLFDVPISDENGWKTLPWGIAISEWKDGELFPIEILRRKHFTFPEALVSAYLILVAEQAELIVSDDELNKPSLWENAGRQFCEEVEKRKLTIPNMELIPKTKWKHPKGNNVSKCLIAVRSLFQNIEGAQPK